ncbi:MAG: hypothetical protein KC983_04500, partial [Phycisphaerales bacterium]|nr:hypothetical protein [Phycisphaerales bacterium]
MSVQNRNMDGGVSVCACGLASGCRTLALMILVVLALTTRGFGGTVDLIQQQSWDFPLSPNLKMFTFDQFDPMGGSRELLKVTMTVEGELGADVTAENDSALVSPNFAVSFLALLQSSFVDLSTVCVDNIFAVSPVVVGPSDGMPEMGRDFVDFGSISATC